jgi:hypothetical protein
MLFYKFMAKNPKYSKLWMLVVKQILLLSHGQATVERGFSINKEVVVENQLNESLVSQRILCDHLDEVGGVLNVNINEQMLMSAASARHRYNAYLEDRRKEQENTKRG